jgi:general stress protein 26
MSDHTQSPLKQKFWTQMSKSPFVMLELDNVPHSAVPMTAQLDKEAHGTIWFFTSREGPLAQMGPATATFVAKDHKLFARLTGHLTEETDQDRFDKLWTSPVAAWFPEGKGSPHVLLMRMDLGEASLWGAKLGAVTLTKMLLGINVYEDVREQRAETSL